MSLALRFVYWSRMFLVMSASCPIQKFKFAFVQRQFSEWSGLSASTRSDSRLAFGRLLNKASEMTNKFLSFGH